VKFQKPKQLQVENSGDFVKVSSDVPLKGVTLEKDGVEFDCNLFDLVPDETISVKASSLQPDHKVEVRFYVPDRHE
jgi:hypothetical protein